jgi:RNA polymerase sigma factor (sigma-70 family)
MKLVRKNSPQDLVQETLIEAIDAVHRFTETEEYHLKAWLRRILINKGLNVVTKFFATKKRDIGKEVSHRSPVEKANTESSPLTKVIRKEDTDRVRKALGKLEPEDQFVIELRVYSAYSWLDIGEIMGHPEGTVRERFAKAIIRLGKKLDEETTGRSIPNEAK